MIRLKYLRYTNLLSYNNIFHNNKFHYINILNKEKNIFLNFFTTNNKINNNNIIENLADGVISGKRYSLSKAITLVESSLPSDQDKAIELMKILLKKKEEKNKMKMLNNATNFVVGIAGTPGVGKSSFIEQFGTYLTSLGKKVAVLSIDPSSIRSRGSILGDKTRMPELSKDPLAYIRPSPTNGVLGGINRHTFDTIKLIEMADYDIIIVETVGLGQSEIEVDNVVDLFLLLLTPGGGDDLQGVKKGIMEISDLILINKADGDLLQTAKQTRLDYKHALLFQRPKYDSWKPKVLLSSSLDNKKIPKIWNEMINFKKTILNSSEFYQKREKQNIYWLIKDIKDQLIDKIDNDNELKNEINSHLPDLISNTTSLHEVSRILLKNFINRQNLNKKKKK